MTILKIVITILVLTHIWWTWILYKDRVAPRKKLIYDEDIHLINILVNAILITVGIVSLALVVDWDYKIL